MPDQPEADPPAAADAAPAPSDDHSDWVASVFGTDPRSYPATADQTGGDGGGTPPVAAAMPAEAPIVEEIEEGVVSGIRAVAPAVEAGVEVGVEAGAAAGAGEVALGVAATVAIPVAAAAAGVALAVGVGYLISHGEELQNQPDPEEQHPPGGLPDGTGTDDNPDGGAPSASDRNKPQRGVKPDLPPPVPGVDYDDDNPPATPSCQNSFPNVPICNGGGGFNTPEEAVAQEPSADQVARYTSDTMSDFANLPDGQNNHRTYYDKSDTKLFSLVKTPCCTDTPAGPVLTWRWHSAN